MDLEEIWVKGIPVIFLKLEVVESKATIDDIVKSDYYRMEEG